MNHQYKNYRDQFNGAMACNTKEEAATWLEHEVADYWEKWKKPKEEALRTIKTNLGYMAGYYDEAVADKVLGLFGAAHPIFGTNYHGRVSAEEAFEAGKQMATKDREPK